MWPFNEIIPVKKRFMIFPVLKSNSEMKGIIFRGISSDYLILSKYELIGLMWSLAIASGLYECLLMGSAAAFFYPKSHDNSHITDADSTKHSGLIDVDNDNKHPLLHDQDG